jgi:TRAP-type C4-dicarboxylate transport system substrate-binding protein
MCAALAGRTVASILAERSGTMTRVTRLATFILAVTAAVAATACSVSGGAGDDKAGGTGPPVQLRLANTGADIAQTPAVKYFVERVDELSGGQVRIKVVDQWADFAPDAEQQVVHDVAAGEVDLGWAGSRVFDTLGVGSFQALTAPTLIDSYALENAVIESGVTDDMMEGLDELGVLGLAVLADALRRPVSVNAPILAPADWKGTSFGTLKSAGQVEAIRALDGDPMEVFGPHREEALANGTLHGFEFGLPQYTDPMWSSRAPYVAGNVHLWPQMDVVLANPERLDGLTSKQRGWLEEAAEDAARRSAELANRDTWALDVACKGGARFADASEADLAALRGAFRPVYAALRRDSATRAFLARIQGLKRATPAEAGLTIPSECTGKAPTRPSVSAAKPPSYLNGTYRMVLTQADADRAGDTEDENYPLVQTITLKDGRLEGGCFGVDGATYSVEGDRITFHSIEYDADSTVSFTRDEKGSLDLEPVPPIDPGDAFTCFYNPWVKID